jgi:hypothetical protein
VTVTLHGSDQKLIMAVHVDNIALKANKNCCMQITCLPQIFILSVKEGNIKRITYLLNTVTLPHTVCAKPELDILVKLTKLQLRASQEVLQRMQNAGQTKHFNAYIKENYIDKGKGHLFNPNQR